MLETVLINFVLNNNSEIFFSDSLFVIHNKTDQAKFQLNYIDDSNDTLNFYVYWIFSLSFFFSILFFVQIQGFVYGILSILALLAHDCQISMRQSKLSYLMYIIFFRG